nr:hypothetical protein [Pseudovibrio stylochi]
MFFKFLLRIWPPPDVARIMHEYWWCIWIDRVGYVIRVGVCNLDVPRGEWLLDQVPFLHLHGRPATGLQVHADFELCRRYPLALSRCLGPLFVWSYKKRVLMSGDDLGGLLFLRVEQCQMDLVVVMLGPNAINLAKNIAGCFDLLLAICSGFADKFPVMALIIGSAKVSSLL